MATLKNTTINDTGYFGMPVGTTAQRPASPVAGYMRINSTTNYIEVYYNGNWNNLNYIGVVSATGGTITTSGNYKIHTFYSSGTFTVLDAPPGATVEYMIIGGGGGGGTLGGGGGAGGYLAGNSSVSVTAYSIVIGAGAVGGAPGTTGGTGSNSTSLGLTAYGGGGGGSHQWWWYIYSRN
jgi:hypothetical protein